MRKQIQNRTMANGSGEPLPPAGSALSALLVNDPTVSLRTLNSAMLGAYPQLHVAVIADPADSIDNVSGVTACTQLRSVPSIRRPTKKRVPGVGSLRGRSRGAVPLSAQRAG